MCVCSPKLWMSAFLLQEAQWSQNKEVGAADLVRQMDLLQD